MLKILTDLIDGTELFKRRLEAQALESSQMQAKVFSALINAALTEHDFPVAYDLCINKLVPLITQYPSDQLISEAASTAFYRTGIFTSRIRTPIQDYQKMEVLARAMLICPKSEIEGILGHWSILENRHLHPQSTAEMDQGVFAGSVRSISPVIDAGNGTHEGRGSGELSKGISSSRFHVRDTVKTGLTQGIGWLLGANPQSHQDTEDHR
jgi:Secretory pathway protein Sec39